MKQESLPRMSIRRNLCASLPPQSPQSVAKAQVFEEGMFPLQCSPEPTKKSAQVLPLSFSSTMDPNMTFEVLDNDDQTASNATIIISGGSPCQSSKSTDFPGPSRLLHPPKANEGNQIPTKKWENIHVLTFLLICVYNYLEVKCTTQFDPIFYDFSEFIRYFTGTPFWCFGNQGFACKIARHLCSHVYRFHSQPYRHVNPANFIFGLNNYNLHRIFQPAHQ